MPWFTVRRRRRRRDDAPEALERRTAQAFLQPEPNSEEVPRFSRDVLRRGAVELRAREARPPSEVSDEESVREEATEEEAAPEMTHRP